jgi:DNA-binding response OmpR family regulator
MARIKVLVMNTSHEVTDMLQAVLTGEGFDVIPEFTYVFKREEKDFDKFLEDNKPDVILYDIGLPYEENYRLFLQLSKSKLARNIPFVLTTTNKDVLDLLVGKTKTFELIGKPYDLDVIIRAIKNAVTKKPILSS